MAVLHTINIHERYMLSAIKNRLQFEQIEEMLKRMDASLSSQANVQGL
jgi:tRNA 2-selenouridine synthase SelU